MTVIKLSVILAGLMLEVLPALSEDGNGQPGTVNYFSTAQRTKAFTAAIAAGYKPAIVEAFQDGNFYLTATKFGQSYELTVVQSGQVYSSARTSPRPMTSPRPK